MHVGYLGVVVPERDFWQGCYIDDGFAARADRLLATMRASPLLRSGSQVITKLDIPDEDQSMVGGLCATTFLAAIGETEHPQTVIGTCGYALWRIIGRKYFWIEGKSETNGSKTSITPIYVSSIDEARDTINSLTPVRKIKRRLMARFAAEGQQRSSGLHPQRGSHQKRWPAMNSMISEINRAMND